MPGLLETTTTLENEVTKVVGEVRETLLLCFSFLLLLIFLSFSGLLGCFFLESKQQKTKNYKRRGVTVGTNFPLGNLRTLQN